MRITSFITLSSTLVFSFLSGCGPSAESLVALQCECEGCSEPERQDLLDNLEDAIKKAEEAGCGDFMDEYHSCLDSEFECRDGKTRVDGCESELQKLQECGLDALEATDMTSGKSGSTSPEAVADACCETSECTVEQRAVTAGSFDNLKQEARETGCEGEYEVYAQCSIVNDCSGNCPVENLVNCFVESRSRDGGAGGGAGYEENFGGESSGNAWEDEESFGGNSSGDSWEEFGGATGEDDSDW